MGERFDRIAEVRRRGLVDRLSPEDRAFHDTAEQRGLFEAEAQQPAPVAAPAPVQQPAQEPISLIPQLLEGATLGFSDEILSRISGVPQETLTQQRQAEAAQFPAGVSTGAEIAGALAPTLTGVGAVTSATRGAPALIQKGSQFLLGVGEGALAGAGTSEEGERGTGAVIGGLLGAGGEAAGAILNKVAPKILPGLRASVATKADEIITRITESTKSGAAKRAGLLGERASVGELIGEEGQELTSRAIVEGQEAPALAREFLEVEGDSVARGAKQDAAAALGTTPEKAAKTQDFRTSEMAAARTRAYADALQQPTPVTEKLADALNSERIVALQGKAGNVASANRRAFESPYAPADEVGFGLAAGPVREVPEAVVGTEVSTQGIDDILDVLGREIDSPSLGAKEQRGLIEQKNRILAALEDANPAYRNAQGKHAALKRVEESFDEGGKILTGKKGEFRESLLGKSPAERAATQRGAVSAVEEGLLATPSGVPTALKKEGTKDKFGLLFGEEAASDIAKVPARAEARKKTLNTMSKALAKEARERVSGELGEGVNSRGMKGFKVFSWTAAKFSAASEAVSRILSKSTPPEVLDEVMRKLIVTENAEKAFEAILESGASQAQAREIFKQVGRVAGAGAAPAGLLATEEK